MRAFEEKDYQIFDLFQNQWALVTAGTPERFNACTLSWGCMGTIWNKPTVTVYLHPSRYTRELMMESDVFTVSFFPEEQKRALAIMGARSGRDGDKTAAAGLTPVPFGGGVTYKEASRTFLCRKLYQHLFCKEDLDREIQAYYRANPAVYPPDENGDWQPHWVFVGEVLEGTE